MKETILLSEIKQNPFLKELRLVRRGNRLSVMPVTAKEWKAIIKMEKR
jgi:predicted RNA-binding protein with PUA-like domain